MRRRPLQSERVALLCAAVVNKVGGDVAVGGGEAVGGGGVRVRAGDVVERYMGGGGGVREWWLGGGLHL